MLKNAFLSIRKSIGKTVLLFVIIFIIANLVIAGFSIKSASLKATQSIQSTLGNDVTLQVDFKNMMKNREPGQAVDQVTESLTIKMAEQLKNLKYVDSYNYTISSNVNTTLTAVENETQEELDDRPMMGDRQNQSTSFTLSANTTMKYLKDFTDENYVLSEGRLLSSKDQETNYCVIETNLAKENDLSIGDTFTMTSSDDSKSVELTIVGIYEIESTTMEMGRMNSNPVNTIYCDLSVGQSLSSDEDVISSATYYLDDPEHVEAFQELAKEKTDIDFDTYRLTSNDQLFKNNSSSLDNISSFASLFLVVVIIAGCAILCLILALTIRNRYYEIGVFLSLGQSKIKIILQQLFEIGMIAVIALILSLGTGKMTSNIISAMLATQNNEVMMNTEDQNMPQNNRGGRFDFNNAFEAPESQELDVSLTSDTVVKLSVTTVLVCIVSTIIPTIYVLRLTPREILMKKEG